MRLTWDPEKSAATLRNRGIDFDLASRIWADPFLRVQKNLHLGAEQRWEAIGTIEGGGTLVVVHTVMEQSEDGAEEVIRIISARKATKHEARRYRECQ